MNHKADDHQAISDREVVFTPHALRKMNQRRITKEEVISIVREASERIPERDDRMIFQGKRAIEGREYLYRVVIEQSSDTITVITVYRTSKIVKYSRDGRK